MEKKDIISFFDQRAPYWDNSLNRNEDVIAAILNNSGIRSGIRVLDVACGTGVLFPDYLKRNVASVTGIDISQEMVKIARRKFPNIETICADVEAVEFDQLFDVVMIYNAFPHFPDPGRLIERLAKFVASGGRLSVAHGMSRSMLAKHHERRAKAVSIELMEENELETNE